MDRISFDGRTVIVTGAGNNLGAEYAREFGRRGASVVVNDIRPEDADRVAGEIRSAGGKALANYDSVGEIEGAESLVASAVRESGRVDALINNAGWNPTNSAFEDLTLKELEGLWSVHARGALLCAQHAYRQMKKQRYGRIVNVSSTAGVFGIWGLSAYGAMKTFQLGFMNVIALEGAEHGILVNALLPGARPVTLRKMNARPEEIERNMRKLGPLHARGTHAFVAPMVVYLASEACDRTHHMYSASSGWYTEVFFGLCQGWLSPKADPPTAEDIQANLGVIEDRGNYLVPRSNQETSDFMAELGHRVLTPSA